MRQQLIKWRKLIMKASICLGTLMLFILAIPGCGSSHEHSYTIDQVVNPTCTDLGYTVYKCECGNTYKDNYLVPTGHTYGEWYVVANPTCTDEGTQKRDCLNCSNYETGKVNPKGHTYTKETIKPTCTEFGYTQYTCTCGHSYKEDYITPKNHSYGVVTYIWSQDNSSVTATRICLNDSTHVETETVATTSTITQTQSCTKVELTKYTAVFANPAFLQQVKEIETKAAAGHSYTSVVTKPTCTQKGYTTYTCACGDTYTGNEVDALGHTEIEIPAVEATCTTAGSTAGVKCSACQEVLIKPQELPAKGHSYTSVVTEPTCTAEGYTTYTCTCGHSYKENYVMPKNHSYGAVTYTWSQDNSSVTATRICLNDSTHVETETVSTISTITQEQSCTKVELTKYTAVFANPAFLQQVKEIETKAAAGHSHTSLVTEPTCTQKGYTTYTCACGDTYTGNEVDALGHSYESVVTEPTCELKGYTTHTCKVCGHSYTDSETEAKGHTAGEATQENVVPATCKAAGSYEEVVKCSVCGEELSRTTKEIAKLAHTEEVDAAVAPTCTATGLTEGKHCSECGEIIVKQEVLLPVAHTYIKEIVEPTCGSLGYTLYMCECGNSYKDDHVLPLGHDFSKTTYIWADDNSSVTATRVCLNDSTHIETETVEVTFEIVQKYQCEEMLPEITRWSSDEFINPAFRVQTKDIVTQEAKGHIYEGEDTYCSICKYTIGLEFILNGDGRSYYCIRGTLENPVNVVIPETYYGKPVTSVGSDSFMGCSNLKSVTLPNSIKVIGNNAFSGCNQLEIINLPDSISSIGDSAFMGCTSLKEVKLPSQITIISNSLFEGCTSLESIELPSETTTIGDMAFNNCSSLSSILIPSKVTYIGYCAFTGMVSLETIVVDENNTVYDSRDNCNAIIESETNTLLYGCKNTVIPSSVEIIGDQAFYDCINLMEIMIPEGVKNIGYNAFGNCSSLKNIFIPSSVTYIGEYAFYGCISLETIVVDENNTVYDSRDNCNALIETESGKLLIACDNTIIPDNIAIIAQDSFKNATKMKSLVVPDNIQICQGAFGGCESLESISIMSLVFFNEYEWDFYYSFSSAFGYDSISVPKTLKEVIVRSGTVSNSAFYGCSNIETVILPDTLRVIGNNVFFGCSSLKNIVIPNSVFRIGDSAFNGCVSLESISLPESVSNIMDYAFANCISLKEVYIPGTIERIYRCAFENCTSLEKVIIFEGVTSIETDAFAGCDSLVIYCEAEEQPLEWYENWHGGCQVVYGYCPLVTVTIIDSGDGTTVVTANGEEFSSGTQIAKKTLLSLVFVPKEGYQAIVVDVNGERINVRDLSTYELTITSETVIEVIYEEIKDDITFSVSEFNEYKENLFTGMSVKIQGIISSFGRNQGSSYEPYDPTIRSLVLIDSTTSDTVVIDFTSEDNYFVELLATYKIGNEIILSGIYDCTERQIIKNVTNVEIVYESVVFSRNYEDAHVMETQEQYEYVAEHAHEMVGQLIKLPNPYLRYSTSSNPNPSNWVVYNYSEYNNRVLNRYFATLIASGNENLGDEWDKVIDIPYNGSTAKQLGTNIYAYIMYVSGSYIQLAIPDADCFQLGEGSQEGRYAVIFDTNGAESVQPVIYPQAEGASISLPEAPIKTGYKFLGWNDGTTLYSAGESYIMPSHEVIFTANWKKLMITEVTLQYDNGQPDDHMTLVYDEYYDLGLPTKEGYVFGGWYEGDTLVEKTSGVWSSKKETMTLKARWIKTKPEGLKEIAKFEFGTDDSSKKSENNYEGTEVINSYTETNNCYTLTLTDVVKIFKNSYDGKGNAVLKVGSSSVSGSFKFEVPKEVSLVTINVAGYKSNTCIITVNGIEVPINTTSANGMYTEVVVDTTTTKLVSFAVTTNTRCKIASISYHGDANDPLLKELPSARLEGTSSYSSNDSGIQINPSWASDAEKLIDYMNRADAVYIDARNYSQYYPGHIEGFICVPYFDLVQGTTGQLFTVTGDEVVQNYVESVEILKEWIPDDKVIFMMCQSGGRTVNFMKVLEYCGYDMSRVYNVGGWAMVAQMENYGEYPVVIEQEPISDELTLPENLTHICVGETTYVWSDDNLSVTATKTCEVSYCMHVETETVEVTSEVIQEKTCELPELTSFVSKAFKNTFFEIQTKEVITKAAGHVEVIDDAIEATCTTTGLSEGRHCSVCNEVLVAQEEIETLNHPNIETIKRDERYPSCEYGGSYVKVEVCLLCYQEISSEYVEVEALGHDLVNYGGYSATCTEFGVKNDKRCTRCEYRTYDIIDPLGHKEVIDRAVAPTCTTTGLTEGKHCSVCSEIIIKQEKVNALGHSYISEVTDPTCELKGYTTHICTFCGYSYVDGEQDALGHKYEIGQYKNATCTEDGYVTYICDNDSTHKYTSTFTKLPHTEEVDEEVAPTCESTGLTEGKHCSVCGEVLVAQEEIPALGHSYESKVTKPTCESKGYTTHTCKVCGHSYTDSEIEELGHTAGEATQENVVEATCKEAGSYDEVVKCRVCGEELSRTTKEIAKLAHTEVTDEAVAPTCESTGLTEGKHCSVCGEVLVAQQEVAALGHELTQHEGQVATCKEAGWKAYETCSRCEHTTYEEIPATGHTEEEIPAVEATCTTNGSTAGTKCSVCGEIITAPETVEAKGHTAREATQENVVPATCKEAGSYEEVVKCSVCGEELSRTTKEIAKLAHTEEVDAAVAPTCESTGLTEGSHCSVCGEVIVEQEIIPITHAYVDYICIDCGYHYYTDGLKFTMINNENCMVESYDGEDTEVVIPMLYEGKKVIVIGDSAFKDCNIVSVILPNGLEVIDKEAFYNCYHLSYIEIPNSVTSIGDNAFCCCSSLKSIEIPSSVTLIGSAAFECCADLTSIELPSSVTEIRWSTFSYCSSLTSIEIPSSVASIGWRAFYNCSSLTSIEIPSSVTFIDSAAFEGCTDLISVEIPEGVTSIGWRAFYNCSSLTSIEIPSSVTFIDSAAFEGCTDLTSIIVDQNNIVYDSRENCNAIIKTKSNALVVGCRNTKIPKGITSIETSAFAGCSNLTSIEIPEGVTIIKASAFAGCSNLTSIEIPEGVTSIETSAFYECISLTSIELPSSVAEIGWSAFYGCINLTSVEIPEGVTSIEDSAFYGCSCLTSVTIHNSVKTIEESAFAGCKALQNIYFIGTDEQWNNMDIQSGNVLLEYANVIFVHSCEYVTNVIEPTCIDQGYTIYTCECGSSYVDNYVDAFGHSEEVDAAVAPTCESTGLTEGAYCSVCGEVIVAQQEVAALGHDYQVSGQVDATCTTEGHTTYVCTNDATHTYTETTPATGHTPGEATQENIVGATCKEAGSYEEVVKCSVCGEELSRTTKEIAKLPHTEVIDEAVEPTCTETGLTEGSHCSVCGEVIVEQVIIPITHSYVDYICIDCGYHYYTSGLTFTLMDDDTYMVSGYSGSDLDVVIPAIYNQKFVTKIGSYAFCGNGVVENVVIPNGVTNIDEYAFEGCRTLKNVKIPDSVISIGNSAFQYCTKLTTLLIPDSVEKVGIYAFHGCYSLKSVQLSNSLNKIESGTFSECSKLEYILIPSSVIEIGSRAFYKCSNLRTVTIPNSVTSIGYEVFSGCTSLESIVVDKSNIVYDSRDNCNAIIESDSNKLISGCQSTIIPNSVTSIGYYAFLGCSSLTSITIPNSVTSIGDDVFYGCSSLTRIYIPNSVTKIGKYVFSECESLTIYCEFDAAPSTWDSDWYCGCKVEYGCSSTLNVLIRESINGTTIASINNQTIEGESIVPFNSTLLLNFMPKNGYYATTVIVNDRIEDVSGQEEFIIDVISNIIVDVIYEEKPPSYIAFEFGEDEPGIIHSQYSGQSTSVHGDGSDLGTSMIYTQDSYSLEIKEMSKVFGPAYDLQGNACIKVGSSNREGTFTFDVPLNVTSVIIRAAKYKTYDSVIDINGTLYSLTKNSNDGEYDEIVLDTTFTKKITTTTVEGTRCMITSISFLETSNRFFTVEQIYNELQVGSIVNAEVVVLAFTATNNVSGYEHILVWDAISESKILLKGLEGTYANFKDITGANIAVGDKLSLTNIEVCKTKNAAIGNAAPDYKYLQVTTDSVVLIVANNQDIYVDNNIETISCEADIKTQLSDIKYYDVIKFSTTDNPLVIGRSAKTYANANMYLHYQNDADKNQGLSGYTANDEYTITSENGTLSYADGSDAGCKFGISRYEPLKTVLSPESNDGVNASCNDAQFTGGELYGVVTHISAAYVIITIVNEITLSNDTNKSLYEEVSLKEIKDNIELYEDKKVRFEAVVTRKDDDQTYFVEDIDLNTGVHYAIPVYVGYNFSGINMMEVGNRLSIAAIISYSESIGYYATGLVYYAMVPNHESNTKLISIDNEVVPTVVTSSELLEAGEILNSSYVKITNLSVIKVETIINGSNAGAMTLTCQDDDNVIKVRTSVLYDENGNLITEETFADKVITIVGNVKKYDGEYQLHLYIMDDVYF